MTSTAARRAGMASMLMMVAVFSTACTAEEILTLVRILSFFI